MKPKHRIKTDKYVDYTPQVKYCLFWSSIDKKNGDSIPEIVYIIGLLIPLIFIFTQYFNVELSRCYSKKQALESIKLHQKKTQRKTITQSIDPTTHSICKSCDNIFTPVDKLNFHCQECQPCKPMEL